jgi:hypothetical protein
MPYLERSWHISQDTCWWRIGRYLTFWRIRGGNWVWVQDRHELVISLWIVIRIRLSVSVPRYQKIINMFGTALPWSIQQCKNTYRDRTAYFHYEIHTAEPSRGAHFGMGCNWFNWQSETLFYCSIHRSRTLKHACLWLLACTYYVCTS